MLPRKAGYAQRPMRHGAWLSLTIQSLPQRSRGCAGTTAGTPGRARLRPRRAWAAGRCRSCASAAAEAGVTACRWPGAPSRGTAHRLHRRDAGAPPALDRARRQISSSDTHGDDHRHLALPVQPPTAEAEGGAVGGRSSWASARHTCGQSRQRQPTMTDAARGAWGKARRRSVGRRFSLGF